MSSFFLNIYFNVFNSVQDKDNLFTKTNFDMFERMQGQVSVCTCNRGINGRSFGDGGHVLCGKDAHCPREDKEVSTNKCLARGKRSINALFTFVPGSVKEAKVMERVIVLLFSFSHINAVISNEKYPISFHESLSFKLKLQSVDESWNEEGDSVSEPTSSLSQTTLGLVFSSPKPKARVRFPDHNLSAVSRRC